MSSLKSLDTEITTQLLNLGANNQVQWNSFVKKMSQSIISNYKTGSKYSYQKSWKKTFKEHSKRLGFKVIRDSSHNDVWAKEIAGKLKPSAIDSSSSSVGSSTSSLQYQKNLTENDKSLLKDIHEKINDKWVLKGGVIVEDALYDQAKDYCVEHPLHSYIVHVNDSNLVDLFKPEEVKEIEEESGKADLMNALPASLATMLMNLDGKNDFDSIDKAFQDISCNRLQQPEEYWCRESILNYLNLFIEKDSASIFPTEQDLLNDMYGFIKNTKHISKTTTETGAGSSASNYNKNLRRQLGATHRIERQMGADHSDLTFKYLSSELGCVEIGLVDHGPGGTKELQETKLKTPKMMRCFCSRIVDQYKIRADKIKIVSVIISGPFITAGIMTFSQGSIGLLYTSPRLKMPENIGEIPYLLPPVLTLIYNCAQVMKNTAQFLKKNTASINLDLSRNMDYFFPSCYVPENNSSLKKRKTSSS